MLKPILYVVNKDTNTSIPLEVAGALESIVPNFETIVLYANENNKINTFSNVKNLKCKSVFHKETIIKVYLLIKNKKPKVVHCHHTASTFLFFIICRLFFSDIKLIKTVHTSNYSFRVDQKILNLLIYLLADNIVCNSQTTYNSFTSFEKLIARNKTRVIYNGVNLSGIESAKHVDNKFLVNYLNRDEMLIGSVGRLVKEKDFATLIKAFHIVESKTEGKTKLVLIGGGDQKSKLAKLVKELGLSDKVVFTGSIEREQVYSSLYLIDIVVVPSLAEGFCNTLVEAMAAKKSIVCSDIPTLREVADDAVLFAEAGKYKEFANQILNVINNKQLKEHLEYKAKKRAGKFTLETCANSYSELYM